MKTVGQDTKNMVRKIRIRVAMFSFIIILGTTLYLLADRFLFEHVEIANVQGTASATRNYVQESKNGASASETSTGEAYTADGWNYVSDSKKISIKEVVSGTGQNAVTYFVADVMVSDAATLQSAFAKAQFGTNIIEYTSKIAADNDAVLAVNGDYYGFRQNGILIRNGQIYRNSPARAGLKIYKEGTMEIYDETLTTAEELLDEGVWQTFSFGPALVTNGQAQTNFDDVEIDTNFGNRSIEDTNPRTGIGMIAPNHFVFVVVDGRSNGYSKGMTLSQFAEVFADLGCTQAYNLDGGGSSTMYFMGRVVNNPLGKNQERGTSDIIYIK